MTFTLDELALEMTTAAVQQAPKNQEKWLLEQLGAEVLANSNGSASYFSATRSNLDLQKLGKRILRRLERELQALLCGSSEEDENDRNDLGIGRDSVIGAITLALVSGLGVAPAIAAIVAAIIMRRLAEPSMDEACKYWAEKLPRKRNLAPALS